MPESAAPALKFPTPISPQPRPWKCPVCHGVGTVPADFYQQVGYVTSTNSKRCRSCGGRGIIIA